ncbi:MAG: DUF2306 domain-containing protein [Gemmatimonadaceae bacterium]
MTTVDNVLPQRHEARAHRVLSGAVMSWFVVAVVGQWLFAVYIIALYGRAVVTGDAEAWTRVMPKGRVDGDVLGNAALLSHVLLAVVIMIGGPLQLVPQLRNRYRALHRWTGWAYLVSAVTISIGGLFLVWTRGQGARFVQHLGISLDGVLVIAFSGLALRAARAKQFGRHRKWALRLFVVSSGVWFFRVGVFLSLLLNGGPFGFDADTFDGPFLQVMSFADYLVPLAILEAYLVAEQHGGSRIRFAMASMLGLASVATATGVFAVFMIAWKKHILG